LADKHDLAANRVEVQWCELVDSTNERLLRLPWIGANDTGVAAVQEIPGQAPLRVRALAARQQSAGRGQKQRSWFAEPGMSLLLSVAIDRPKSTWPAALSGFSIACASAAIDALESAPVAGYRPEPIGIKWPNDLVRLRSCSLQPGRSAPGFDEGSVAPESWLEKIAGLLIETRQSADQSRIVIGLGLNLCRPTQHSAPAAWQDQLASASLALAASASECRRMPTLPGGLLDDSCRGAVSDAVLRELAHRLAQALSSAWLCFEHSGLSPFREGIERREVLRGRWVEIEDEAQVGKDCRQAKVVGIDAQGFLRVKPLIVSAAVNGSPSPDLSGREVPKSAASRSGALKIAASTGEVSQSDTLRLSGASLRLLRGEP